MQTYIDIHFPSGTAEVDKTKTFEYVTSLGWTLSQTFYRMAPRYSSNEFKSISGYIFFWGKETEPVFPKDDKIIYGVSNY